MKKPIAALAIYTALLSCTSEPITYGTVSKKWHEPEREYVVTTENLWTGYELKKRFVDDEDFIVVLQQFGGTKFRSTRQRQIYVSKTVYNSLKVGDSVDLNSSQIKYKDSDKDIKKE